jgi:NhaP-type Na+/H+ or K+/H+ antiporter
MYLFLQSAAVQFSRRVQLREVNLWKYACLACLSYIFAKKVVLQLLWRWFALQAASADVSPAFAEVLYTSPERQLLSGNASNTSTSQVSSAGFSGSHHGGYEALFFFFNALIFGTIILHLTTIPRFHNLQQTVCLFVLGVLYSLVQEGLNLKEHLGVFGRSYAMWMDIDPHLLLFTLLPALLAGDAMTIDTSVARSVAKQCLFLAGPGVLFGSFATALFLYWFIPDWDFLLCLTCGSILAATDPVAVVGLLKELGASPILTMQIQGESLLNDGTAIVLYTISYDMLKGGEYDVSEVVIFLVIVVFCAVALGIALGFVFLQWIRLACDRLDHDHAGMLQTTLTLCCAYWSFCLAEGWLKISGVLCTVSASLMLADKMWPYVVDKQSMLHIWHMVEYIGNTVIFFLAGALTGNTMVDIPAIDYLRLLVIYIVCMFIRATLFFGSRHILRLLSPERKPVRWEEACVMTWGGLRGAVGLALAIQVSLNKEDTEGRKAPITEMDGKRVLFYVGGVAALTLIVNATTCPRLVSALGVTKTPAARQQMLYKIFSQLRCLMIVEEPNECIREAMETVLAEAKHHIDVLVPSHERYIIEEVRNPSGEEGGFFRCSIPARSGTTRFQSTGSAPEMDATGTVIGGPQVSKPRNMRQTMKESRAQSYKRRFREWLRFTDRSRHRSAHKNTEDEATEDDVDSREVRSTLEICEHLSDARDTYNSIRLEDVNILDLPSMPFLAEMEEMEIIIREHDYDPVLVKSVNSSFLSLVSHEYWHQLESGEFIAGTADAELLINSINEAQRAPAHLSDLQHLLGRLKLSHSDTETSASVLDEILETEQQKSVVSKRKINRDERAEERMSGTPTDTALAAALQSLPDILGVNMNSESTRLVQFIDSTLFNMLMSTTLVANCIFIIIELRHRSGDNYSHRMWTVMEVAFTLVFVVEFTIKFAAVRCRYFCDSWNLFDFGILCTSLVGLVIDMLPQSDSANDEDISNEARMFRLNRVFRIVRILRVIRLFNFFRKLLAKLRSRDISLQLAEHLRTITACRAFARAHVSAQCRLLELFGRDGNFTQVEEMRCVMESQTAIYRAIKVAVEEATEIAPSTLMAMQLLRETIEVTSTLADFVHGAEEVGVLTNREANTIAEPLQDHVRLFQAQIDRAVHGGDTAGVELVHQQSLNWSESATLASRGIESSSIAGYGSITTNGFAGGSPSSRDATSKTVDDIQKRQKTAKDSKKSAQNAEGDAKLRKLSSRNSLVSGKSWEKLSGNRMSRQESDTPGPRFGRDLDWTLAATGSRLFIED